MATPKSDGEVSYNTSTGLSYNPNAATPAADPFTALLNKLNTDSASLDKTLTDYQTAQKPVTRVEAAAAAKAEGPPSTAPAGYTWKWVGTQYQLYKDPVVAPAGGGGGGSSGGGTDNSALTDAINKQNALAAAAAQATKDAAIATKIKAADAMAATFKQYGLESLGSFISSQIMADTSPEALLIKLYDQPEYQARFPGMAALQKKNRTITEAQYISLENQYAETLRFFDLPKGFMDDRATFGKMIANEVSPKELQDRAQVAQDLAKTTNPLIRRLLQTSMA